MAASNCDLEGAVSSLTQDILNCIREFDINASATQVRVATEHGPGVSGHLDTLIGAYQAVATGVLCFSIHSPRYGILKYRQADGSFLVDL